MAISKILHMKESSKSYPGRHLNVAIDYITNPSKTMDGTLVGTLNCQKDFVYEQMRETKRRYSKEWGRQGYHLIISFNEGEIDENTAFSVIEEFANAYLRDDYEAVYVVHNNTNHMHGHIIWNSIKFHDGKKYRYERGDWEREIQPLVNKLCEKYGLETLNIEESRQSTKDEWSVKKDGPFVWNSMIRRDFDACIIQATNFDMFLDMLSEKGYEIKLRKYLAVKPQGMKKYRRSKTLGEEYTLERINERILNENLRTYQREVKMSPRIVTRSYKRIRRAKLTGLQKKYFARLYQLGKIKKRPYSQYYKYKDDIRKMYRLQEEYFFISRNKIHDVSDVENVIGTIKHNVAEVTKEKRKMSRERKSFEEIFKTVSALEQIEICELSFLDGDDSFISEHKQWEENMQVLTENGYSYEEAKRLRDYYKEKISDAVKMEKQLKRQIHIGEKIREDFISEKDKERQTVMEKEKIIETDRKGR